MLKKLFSVVVLIVATICGTASVYACSCMNPGPPCDATSKSTAVFVGTVVSSKDAKTTGQYDFNSREVKFSVEEAFKGVSSTEVSVFTGWGGGDCGYPFRTGQQYLVYTYSDEKDVRFKTSICSRTRQLSEAKEDLAYLRGLSRASSGSMIFGDVMRFKRDEDGNGSSDPMPNAKIIVTGEDKKLEIESDANGHFKISGLKPGSYKVLIDLPPTMTTGQNEHSVTLEDKACEFIYFGVESNGRLNGQVKNVLGVPIEKAEIFIVAANKPKYRGWWDAAYTEKDGVYSFKRIPPGKYKLQIRFDGLTSQTRPFPTMYYPGVMDMTLATIIEIDDGQEIKDYNIIVPELPKDRTIEGTVVSSDGTLLTDAKVSYFVEPVIYAATMDSPGHFRLNVYEGVSTAVQAHVERNGKQVQSGSVSIPATGEVGKVKLVIPVP
ncbi:MAG: hypothetical protein DMF69_23825 [Acidobacteria bacterium]|nr:MAG: hypothetical protein DMF69_23825 [Acidobacteriota bacterium]